MLRVAWNLFLICLGLVVPPFGILLVAYFIIYYTALFFVNHFWHYSR